MSRSELVFTVLLHIVDLYNGIILTFRVQQIKDRELFMAMDATPEEFKETCKDALGTDPRKVFAHQR